MGKNELEGKVLCRLFLDDLERRERETRLSGIFLLSLVVFSPPLSPSLSIESRLIVALRTKPSDIIIILDLNASDEKTRRRREEVIYTHSEREEMPLASILSSCFPPFSPFTD